MPLFAAHVDGELVAQHFWCGDGGPDPHRLVPAAAGQPVPVGAKRHTVHRAGVPGKDLDEAGFGLVGHRPAADQVRSVESGGQAVDLRGASREVAERMGLMPGIDRLRVQEEGMAYVDGEGRVFGRMSMADFDGEGAVAEIEIARGDLAQVLLDELHVAAGARPGLLELRYGDRITAIGQDSNGVDVEFEATAPARLKTTPAMSAP